MNDFTKEELQSMSWAISYVRERTNNCGDSMRSLNRKIHAMLNPLPVPFKKISKEEFAEIFPTLK